MPSFNWREAGAYTEYVNARGSSKIIFAQHRLKNKLVFMIAHSHAVIWFRIKFHIYFEFLSVKIG